MKSNKTTKQHFNLFKKECKKWLQIFSLGDWEDNYWHDGESSEDGLARVNANADGKRADFYLSKDWKIQPINNAEIKSTAFHEVGHLLLADMAEFARDRNRGYREVDNHEVQHAIIRRLENGIYKRLLDKS